MTQNSQQIQASFDTTRNLKKYIIEVRKFYESHEQCFFKKPISLKILENGGVN